MSYTIALAGNPNCGKTTMFNKLTGSTGHVGNWPGVTVDKKVGSYKKDSSYEILDLPGTYSLSPYSAEEIIAHDYIVKERPDCVVDILESTNFERNMFLALQILETGVPTVLALNMTDELTKNGGSIDAAKLSNLLGIKVIKVSAKTGEGLDDLFVAIKETIDTKIVPTKLPLFETIQKKDEEFVANEIYNFIEKIVKDVYRKGDEDDITVQETTTEKIDKVLTNRILGLPFFIIIMYALFQISLSDNLFGLGINGPGQWLAVVAADIWDFLTGIVTTGVANASPWAQGLVVDGVMGGIGAVISFMPLVFVLYMCITVLEDSGYMARVAFVLDRIFKRFGLSGKSFIPFLMAFGCGVPAIMATRTLDEEKDRRIAAIITTFMPCGAKLPIIALFVAILFPSSYVANVTFLIYILTIVAAIVVSLILNKLWYKGQQSNFLIELPQYRAPQLKYVLLHGYDKVKGFAKKAGTIILGSTILIWFLVNFNLNSFNGVNYETNNGESVMSEMDDSFMASLGNTISPIFTPLGFNGWRPTVGIISGWIAKENLVATFSQLYNNDITPEYVDSFFKDYTPDQLSDVGFENGVYDTDTGIDIYTNDIISSGEDPNALRSTKQDIPTTSGGFAYIMFNMLCMPCFAAVGAMHRELKTVKRTSQAVGIQMLAAYVFALLIRLIGLAFGF